MIFILTVGLGFAAASIATPTCCCAVVVLLTTLFTESQNSRSPTEIASAEVLPIVTTPSTQKFDTTPLVAAPTATPNNPAPNKNPIPLATSAPGARGSTNPS
jgi:hypothetical protein